MRKESTIHLEETRHTCKLTDANGFHCSGEVILALLWRSTSAVERLAQFADQLEVSSIPIFPGALHIDRSLGFAVHESGLDVKHQDNVTPRGLSCRCLGDRVSQHGGSRCQSEEVVTLICYRKCANRLVDT